MFNIFNEEKKPASSEKSNSGTPFLTTHH